MSAWKLVASAPERIPVMTKIADDHGTRNQQILKRIGRLWWFPDGSMYVYYTPTHWREAERGAPTR